MTQTTNALSWKDATIEVNVNSAGDEDISGWMNEVKISPAQRNVGMIFTQEGDYAILTAGKMQPIDIEMNIVYTETVDEPFIDLLAGHEAAHGIVVNVYPQGDAVGNYKYASASGFIVSHDYPQGNPESGDPVPFKCIVRVPSITRSTIAA